MKNAGPNVDRAFARLRDKNYEEPLTSNELAFAMSVAGSLDAANTVARTAIARLAALEDALLPFAVNGGSILHATRLLEREGRSDEPAGGVFVAALDGTINLLPGTDRFLAAIDALGRERVRQQMHVDIAVLAEREAHEAGGGTLH